MPRGHPGDDTYATILGHDLCILDRSHLFSANGQEDGLDPRDFASDDSASFFLYFILVRRHEFHNFACRFVRVFIGMHRSPMLERALASAWPAPGVVDQAVQQ
jgi:hypothetical protein